MSARVFDANGNRAAEGLRVLEELARFLVEDQGLAERCKAMRHALRQALSPVDLAARDTPGDVGTGLQAVDEGERCGLTGLVRANAARVQEALRVLEEWGKLDGALPVAEFERLRYDSYDLEQCLLARLPADRLWRERLYVLIDTALCDDAVERAAAVVAGGAGIVQLRGKQLSVTAYADLAVQVCRAVQRAGGLFIVNDHVAVAQAVGADGVHLGQDDLPIAVARASIGPIRLIGLSCHTPEQLSAAQAAGADYVGLGPMYATATKAHEPARGPELLTAVRTELQVPSYAIGGLDADRIAALQVPHGVAVAGALCRAADPQAEAAALVALLASDPARVRV